MMRRETLHLTLAFLGNVAVDQIEVLCATAAGVRAEAFLLTLDHFGSRRRQGLVWATCAAAPPPLLALVQALRRGLSAVGFPLETGAFVPHVTLLRKAVNSELIALPPLPPLTWPVADFVLVQSQLGNAGASYRIIARWPLAAPPTAG